MLAPSSSRSWRCSSSSICAQGVRALEDDEDADDDDDDDAGGTLRCDVCSQWKRADAARGGREAFTCADFALIGSAAASRRRRSSEPEVEEAEDEAEPPEAAAAPLATAAPSACRRPRIVLVRRVLPAWPSRRAAMTLPLRALPVPPAAAAPARGRSRPGRVRGTRAATATRLGRWASLLNAVARPAALAAARDAREAAAAEKGPATGGGRCGGVGSARGCDAVRGRRRRRRRGAPRWLWPRPRTTRSRAGRGAAAPAASAQLPPPVEPAAASSARRRRQPPWCAALREVTAGSTVGAADGGAPRAPRRRRVPPLLPPASAAGRALLPTTATVRRRRRRRWSPNGSSRHEAALARGAHAVGRAWAAALARHHGWRLRRRAAPSRVVRSRAAQGAAGGCGGDGRLRPWNGVATGRRLYGPSALPSAPSHPTWRAQAVSRGLGDGTGRPRLARDHAC